MAVPTDLTQLSVTAASNSPSGSDSIGTSLDDFLRIIQAMLKEAGATLYTAGGTADVITFSTTPTFSAYATGQRFWFLSSGANTGAVTLNINGVGAKAVTRDGTTALIANDILSGSVVEVVYDGTRFQAVSINQAGNTVTLTGTQTLTNKTLTSPTLTTPALGSPSSVGTMPAFTLGGTVSGGGNQINNVVIGTSTPLAGSFTTLSASGAFTGAGYAQITGTGTPASGAGIELKYAANTGFILAYDRTGAAYKDLEFGGTLHTFKVSGGTVASIASTGLAVTGTLSATGITSVTDVTDATSTTAASLKTAGGLAVVKKGYFGDNIVMASGKGIDFSATSNGSGTTTSEVLSDYEEGTWTPSVGGTATYTSQLGIYTKVGRQVTAILDMTINVLGTGSANQISGLPFTNNSSYNGTVYVSYYTSLAVSPVFITGYVAGSGTTIIFSGATAGAASITNPLNPLGNSSRVIATVTYFV